MTCLGFDLLCDPDPVFTLRFDDDSEFTVVVHRTAGDAFTLTRYRGPPPGREASRL